MGKDLVLEWVTDRNTCFLLGAGCSICAGKPALGPLTDLVLGSSSEKTTKAFAGLKDRDLRKANLEDLIDYLTNVQKILTALKADQLENWKLTELDETLLSLQSQVVQRLADGWHASKAHQEFFQRLRRNSSRNICDVFTLNYDTVIEASLEADAIPYCDGFYGSDTAFFTNELFDQSPVTSDILVRLYKLHGSVNWERGEDLRVTRRPLGNVVESNLVVYPAEQKFLHTQFGIFDTLLNRFRARLRASIPNNKLVVLGYGFADDHINLIIEDSLNTQNTNLHVYSLIGPSPGYEEAQRQYLESFCGRCKNRFTAIVGDSYYVGDGITDEEWEQIRPLELWKFENLSQLMAEG